MSKYIIQRFRKRIENGACSWCGCTKRCFINHGVEYPEVWLESCYDDFGKTLEYQDNFMPQDVSEWIGGVKSKRKILSILESFYC